MAARELWVHEDEDGMRSLWPAQALPHILADMQRSVEAAEKNRDPSGHGYTDMHIISAPKEDFAGLRREAVMAALGPLMPRHERFVVGDGKVFGYRDEDALCFGFDSQCFIYGATAKDGSVKGLWFNAWTGDLDQLAALRKALEAIDALSPAAVADYWVDMAGRVGDRTFLDAYFAALEGE